MQALNTRTIEPVQLNEISTGLDEAMQMEAILAAALADSSNIRVHSRLNRDGKLVEVTRLYYDRGRLTYQTWTLV
jgi:hypothetical protein